MKRKQSQSSQLFLVRLWAAEIDDQADQLDQVELLRHGKIQHVVSGEALTFRGYEGLAEAIERMIAEREDARQHAADE